MARVSMKSLEAIVKRINMETVGVPSCYMPSGQGVSPVVGAYGLDCAYGGYALNQMVGPGGGERVIIGRAKAGEMHLALCAFYDGLIAGKALAK